MKRFVVLLMVTLMAFSMTACVGGDYYQVDSSYTEDYIENDASVEVESNMVDDVLSEIQPEVVYSEPEVETILPSQPQSKVTAGKPQSKPESKTPSKTQSKVTANNGKLTPEEAVNIYMNDKSLWMETPEHEPMCGYGYCLLDLDFDGVLELICSLNDGTGRYSYNRFFRINRSKNKVEEFYSSLSDDSGVDYMYMRNNAKLLKNQSSGKMFYLFQDYVRVSANEGGSVYYECYLKNGKLNENSLFSEYKGMENGYQFAGVDVSKSQYDQKTKDFYAKNKDMNVKWDMVYGDDFDNASTSSQKQMLLKAYRNFSYNGFSF